MTNDLNIPPERPNQEQLERLARQLAEHFNDSKDEPLALAIRQWDEKYSPKEAFAQLRNLPKAFSLRSKPWWEIIFMVIFSPLLMIVFINAAFIGLVFGSLGFGFRTLRSRFNPPRPREADLAHRFRFHLAAQPTLTYRDVIRAVRAETQPFAAYLTDYFTPKGSLFGSQFGHARLEYRVLQSCLQHCPTLVDAATIKAHAAYQQALRDIHYVRDNNPADPEVIILGLCRKCGGSLILKDGGWLTCSRCRYTPHHPAKNRAKFQGLLDERHDREAMKRVKAAGLA